MAKRKKQEVKRTRNEVLQIRYHLYREMGYSAKEASKLRKWSLDVSGIKVKSIEKTKRGKKYNFVKNKYYRRAISKTRKVEINTKLYIEEMKRLENDTVYSNWGMYTSDKRYEDRSMRMVYEIKKDLKLNEKQSYYALFLMTEYDVSYEQVKEMIKTDPNFELYKREYNKSKKRIKGNIKKVKKAR